MMKDDGGIMALFLFRIKAKDSTIRKHDASY
jgi:hypothetical protein